MRDRNDRALAPLNGPATAAAATAAAEVVNVCTLCESSLRGDGACAPNNDEERG